MEYGLSGGLLVSADTEIADANRECVADMHDYDNQPIQSKLTESEL